MYMGRPHFHPSWDPNPSMKTGQCNDLQLRIGGMKARTKRVSSTKSKSMKLWWKDPEIKRRGRVARYKLYGAEGKVKRSLKKGYRWFKRKCLEIVRTIWNTLTDLKTLKAQMSKFPIQFVCTNNVRTSVYPTYVCTRLSWLQISMHACNGKVIVGSNFWILEVFFFPHLWDLGRWMFLKCCFN